MALKEFRSGIFEGVIDTTDVDNMLDRMAVGLADPSLISWLRGDVSPYLEKDIAQRFDSEGDNKSGSWPALHEATIAIREELGFGAGPINVRTGDLREFTETGREFLVGTGFVEMQVPGSPPDPVTAAKLEHAQRGTTANPNPRFGPTVPRPVLAINEGDLAAMMTMLHNHIIAFMTAGPAAAAAA